MDFFSSQQYPPNQQANNSFFGFGANIDPLAAQAQQAVSKLNSRDPREKLAAAKALGGIADTEAALADAQLGIGSSQVARTRSPMLRQRSGMYDQQPYSMGGRLRRRRTYRKSKRGGSCNVAANAAPFKGGRRRSRRNKKRSNRRR